MALLPSPKPASRRLLSLVALLGTLLHANTTQAQQDGLDAALRATLAQHPAMAGKQAELAASNFGLSAARSQRLPSVSVQAARYAADQRSVLSGDDLNTPMTLRIRQPLYTFGRITDNIDAASAERAREQADLLRLGRELLLETALAYAEVQAARARVNASDASLAQLESLREQIQRRAEGQLATEADTRLAETRLAQSRILQTRYEGEVVLALDALQALTQARITANQPIPDSLLSLPPEQELEARILDNSAELLLQEQEVAQARAAVEQSRSAAMPTVYLQAENFHDQPGLRDDNQVSVVIEAGLDALGFANRHRNSAASSRQIAAEQNLRSVRLRVLQDFRRLYQLHALQGDLVLAQEATVVDLEALLASYQRQYESGSKSWLEVLNIQRELDDQRLQLVQAHFERLRHALELLARSGGLDSLSGLDTGNE